MVHFASSHTLSYVHKIAAHKGAYYDRLSSRQVKRMARTQFTLQVPLGVSRFHMGLHTLLILAITVQLTYRVTSKIPRTHMFSRLKMFLQYVSV